MHLYTNHGSYFGYKDGKFLYTYKGKCIGKFKGGKIYGKNGKYLGELSKLNYLVVNPKLKNYFIEPWDSEDKKSVTMQPFQFGRIGVASVKYTDFTEADEF